MELSRRLFLISLGAADFVTYDQREVFSPTPFCQKNVIIWKQNRHDCVGKSMADLDELKRKLAIEG